MPEQKFIIAGGGIGGLAAALGLAQKGHGSIVLEKSTELSEIGAASNWGPTPFIPSTIWALATPREKMPSMWTNSA